MRRGRISSKPTAVDLFCGAGGLSLGLHQAKFRILSAVDLDDDSCRTYKANHLKVNLVKRDIRQVHTRDLLGKRNWRLKNKPLTMVAGCPPCQGFTRLSGTFGRRDARNRLVLEYIRLVRKLKPLVVFFENVPGLSGSGKWYFSRLISALKKEGYKLNCKLLQLADYGVPQRRKRLIVLGGRGFELSFPEPTHSRTGSSRGRREKKRWRTVRQTLKGVGRAQPYAAVRKRKQVASPFWHVSRSLGEEVRKRLRDTPRSGGSREDVADKYELACHAGMNGFHDVYGRLDWNRPSGTITSGCSNISKGRFGHPELLRGITPREAALLQGFPRSYKFLAGGIDSVCEQIGNALPPIFAKKIATHIMKQLRTSSLNGHRNEAALFQVG